MPDLPCCHTWDDNKLLMDSPRFRAVYDGFPVTSGHVLIYPRRHVDRLQELNSDEFAELFFVLNMVLLTLPTVDAPAYTIAINDGEAAGRTVAHLHMHVIPRRHGDVPDPRGGVRQLFHSPDADPWLLRAGVERPPGLTQEQ